MRTKRLAILLSIFALIIVIVVLSSTVFSLSKVELSFLEVPTKYSINDSKEIIDSGKFDYKKSIFLVNKTKHVNRIEEKFPNIKVIGIETRFPNRLVVQVVERQEFLALYNNDDGAVEQKYYVVDGDMKILRIVNNKSAVANVAKCKVSQDLANYQNGDFVAFDAETTILSELASAFWRCGYSEKEMNALVKSVRVDTKNNELNISTYCKFYYDIKSPQEKLAQKLFAGNDAVFGERGVGEDFIGEILVYESVTDGKIYANAILNG